MALLSPCGNRADAVTGSTLPAKGAVAIYGCSASGNAKVATAVFANPKPEFMLHALLYMVANEVVHGFRIEHFRKGGIIPYFIMCGLWAELKR